jgi:hypothetical protein
LSFALAALVGAQCLLAEDDNVKTENLPDGGRRELVFNRKGNRLWAVREYAADGTNRKETVYDRETVRGLPRYDPAKPYPQEAAELEVEYDAAGRPTLRTERTYAEVVSVGRKVSISRVKKFHAGSDVEHRGPSFPTAAGAKGPGRFERA